MFVLVSSFLFHPSHIEAVLKLAYELPVRVESTRESAVEKKGWFFVALYFKQCSTCPFIGGISTKPPEELSVPMSLTVSGLCTLLETLVYRNRVRKHGQFIWIVSSSNKWVGDPSSLLGSKRTYRNERLADRNRREAESVPICHAPWNQISHSSKRRLSSRSAVRLLLRVDPYQIALLVELPGGGKFTAFSKVFSRPLSFLKSASCYNIRGLSEKASSIARSFKGAASKSLYRYREVGK